MQIQGQIHLLVPPAKVYDLWMNSTQHSLMAEGVAVIDPKVGGQYSLWGGSVTGEFVYLRRPDRIVFTWRTEDFGFGDDDSRVELRLDASPKGTYLRLTHDRIPHALLEQFRFGWEKHIFPRLRAHLQPVVH